MTCAPVDSEQTQPQYSLVDFMRRSPLFDLEDLEFERKPELTREIGLRAIWSTPTRCQTFVGLSVQLFNPWLAN